MSFAYSVAIKLTVANLASQGVRLLAADLLAAHGNATALGDKLKALKMTAIGYGMERAGEGILGFMGKAVDVSKDYTHQLSLMNAAGMTHKEIAGSVASAWSTSRSVITSSATENLKAIRELRSVFGKGEGMEHAYAVLPVVQRAQAIMQSLTGKEQPGVAFDMIKAIEFSTKGAVSVPALLRQSEMMTKALTAFGGTLNVSDFHQTFKQLKAAAPYLSDDFKYTVLPTLMQEMKSGHGGAQAAGTAIATLFGTIKGHAIQTRMIPAWMDSGLIGANAVVADRNHKGVSRIMPGGIAGENLFTLNPLAWAQKYLMPARDRLMHRDHVDEIGAYYALTGNRNSAFMLQTLANKAIQIQRDQNLIGAVGSSYGAYQKLLKTDPQLAEQAMHNQWQNVLSIIGFQILPVLVPYMVKFAEALGHMAGFMAAHPVLTKSLAIGGAVAGAGLVVGGKALMTAGILKFLGINPLTLIKGAIGSIVSWAGTALSVLGQGIMFLGRALLMNPVGLTILAIAGAAYVLYRNWSTVGPVVMKVWSIIKAAFYVSMDWIAARAKAMWAVVGPYVGKAWSILVALGGIVGTTFASIYHGITGWLGKIITYIANSPVGKLIGWAGGEVGSAIAGLGGAIGNDFNQAYKWSQDENARHGGGSRFIRPAGSQSTRAGDVYLDKHLVGKHLTPVITNNQVRAMSGPNQGTHRPDYTRTMPRP